MFNKHRLIAVVMLCVFLFSACQCGVAAPVPAASGPSPAPPPSTTAGQNSVKVSGQGDIENAIISYRASRIAVSRIAEHVRALHYTDVLVTTEANPFANFALYQTAFSQLDQLTGAVQKCVQAYASEYQRRHAKGPFAPKFAIPIPSGIGELQELAGVFAQQVTLNAESISPDRHAIGAQMIAALKSDDFSKDHLMYDAYVPPMSYDKSGFLIRLAEADKTFRFAARVFNAVNAKVQANPPDKNDPQLKATAARYAEITNNYQTLRTTLVSVTTAQPISELQQLVQVERKLAFLKDGGLGPGHDAKTCVLILNPVAMGGTTHTLSTLFGNWISYSAGAIINYYLLDSDGSLVEADTISQIEGNHKFKHDDKKLPTAEP